MGAHSPRAAAAGGSPAPALRVAALLAAAVVAATFAFINTSSSGQGQQAALAVRLANSLHSWAGRERGFQTPHSRCSVLADGARGRGAAAAHVSAVGAAALPCCTAQGASSIN